MTRLLSSSALALLAFLFFAGGTGCAAQTPPNLSGLWRLDPGASRLIGGPMGEITWAIEHREPHIAVVVTVTGTEEAASFAFRCVTDGSPCENKLPSIRENRRSTAVWEGPVLVMRTTVEGPNGPFAAVDRLYGAEGGRTLVFERQVRDDGGERQVKQVFHLVGPVR